MNTDVTKVPVELFTTEMVTKNFVALAENAKAIEEWMYLSEKQLASIARTQREIFKKVGGRKKFFVLGVVAGIAVAPTIARRLSKAADKLESLIKDGETKTGDLHADVVIGKGVNVAENIKEKGEQVIKEHKGDVPR